MLIGVALCYSNAEVLAAAASAPDTLRKPESRAMTPNKRIVLSSDHAAIDLRRAIADHIAQQGWEVVDIGPVTPESTPYPKHGEAAARLVSSGDCRLGIILCGTGQGIMLAANKVKGIRCGVCSDTFSARMIRQHNDANMLSIGARVVGAGLALDIVDAFLGAEFEGGRHATRVDMITAIEG
jgi:ribose 5-phosphate isomerase B